MILILGGGLGGLMAAHHLRVLLPEEVKVTVVEKKDTFYYCPLNIRVIEGDLDDPREKERSLSLLAKKGIDWLQAEVLEINAEDHTVNTSKGTLEAENIIIALGAEKIPEGIPGFTEFAYNVHDSEQAVRLHKALEEFKGGRIVVLVCHVPYSCPGAPCETALLSDSIPRANGISDIQVDLYTPEPRPMASAGKIVSDAVLEMLRDRGITYHAGEQVREIVDDHLVFEGGEVPYDLIAGMPFHDVPAMIQESGLTDETGWIPVDLQTLETDHEGIFAIGDVTSIRQPNPSGLFLPKAGIFAEEEARVVARLVAARLKGEKPPGRFTAPGVCYLEIGGGQAVYGQGDFYQWPEPHVTLWDPSERFHKERREYEDDLVETLF